MALKAEAVQTVLQRLAGFCAGAFAREKDGRRFEFGAEGYYVAGLEEVVRFLWAFTGGLWVSRLCLEEG